MAEVLAPGSDRDLQGQVLRLAQENRELSDYSERVTRELRRYQLSKPPPPAHPEEELPLPPWAMNMHMMSPLLLAYEERIAHLEAVIERSAGLAEQTEMLTKENDSLRAQLRERTEQLRAAQLSPHVAELGKSSTAPDDEELQELYRLSLEQNEALAQLNQILKLQLEKMQQTLVAGQQQTQEVQVRMVEGARALHAEQERAEVRMVEAARTLHAEQERSEVLARHRSIAEQQLDKLTGELSEAAREREQLQGQVDALQHELALRHDSIGQYRRLFDDRTTLAKEEQDRLEAELACASQGERECRLRISSLEREVADTSERLFSAQKEAEAAKQEVEQMLWLVESMEKRLWDVSAQHERAREKLLDQENQVSALVLEKEAWAASEHASRRMWDRSEHRLQDEIRALRLDRHHEVNSLHGMHVRVASDMEAKLQKAEHAEAEFQAEAELYGKQRAWEAAALERQSSVHAAERERLQGDFEESQHARLRVQRQADAEGHEASHLRAELGMATTEARQAASQVTSEVASYRSRCQNAEQKLSQARQECQLYESRASDSAAEHARLHAESQAERLETEDALEAERRRAQIERRNLERKCSSLKAKAQQEEQRAGDLLREQDMLRAHLQSELSFERDSFEIQVERLSKENRELRDKARGIRR